MRAKRRKQNPETALKKASLAYFASVGWICWTVNSGTRNHIRFVGVDGHPDIAGYDQTGHAVFVECKMDGEKLKLSQWNFMKKARENGCLVYLAIPIGPVPGFIPFERITDEYKPKEALA